MASLCGTPLHGEAWALQEYLRQFAKLNTILALVVLADHINCRATKGNSYALLPAKLVSELEFQWLHILMSQMVWYGKTCIDFCEVRQQTHFLYWVTKKKHCKTAFHLLCIRKTEANIKYVPPSQGGDPTHTVTGKILLAAVMVMQVLNTTCSQWPCRTQSSEFQDMGRVNVMFISSWASRPAHRTCEKRTRAEQIILNFSSPFKRKPSTRFSPHVQNHTVLFSGSLALQMRDPMIKLKTSEL